MLWEGLRWSLFSRQGSWSPGEGLASRRLPWPWQAMASHGKPWQAPNGFSLYPSKLSFSNWKGGPKSQESTCHSSSQVAVVHSWQRKLRWNSCPKIKLHRNLDCIPDDFYCGLSQQKEERVHRCPLLDVKFPTLRTRRDLCLLGLARGGTQLSSFEWMLWAQWCFQDVCTESYPVQVMWSPSACGILGERAAARQPRLGSL